ncbi:MAG TPA: type II toxin-antitoxin system VapC family toxin [Longimicrobium sp.]|uniref:type II toxin-antitoxin system VapC family toxin n=1 Tax=Longimicrobium sp. TaxID=2029185 RepID=UPI002EDAE7D9
MFETNVIIRHKMSEVPGFVSAVVLQELTAGAQDAADLRRLGSLRAAAEDEGVLLTPDGEDWYEAGKVLNALHRGLRSHRRGRTPAIPKEEQHRLLRDVLIARSAKRINAQVVTYNRGDFEKIRRFCNVQVVEPTTEFG